MLESSRSSLVKWQYKDCFLLTQGAMSRGAATFQQQQVFNMSFRYRENLAVSIEITEFDVQVAIDARLTVIPCCGIH